MRQPIFEVFQSLREQLIYLKEEQGQAWKWKNLADASVEDGKKYLLDYAALVQELSRQIDRSFFQLAVFPDKMEECMGVMSALEPDTQDLWTRCEAQRVKIEELTASLDAANEDRSRMSHLLEEKTRESAEFARRWETELNLRKEFEQKYFDADALLQKEQDARRVLELQANSLQAEILRLDTAKRERLVRAVQQMNVSATEDYMLHIFVSMRRVLALEKATRLQQASEDELKQEVCKLEECKQSLIKKLHDAEDFLENSESRIAFLKVARINCGKRMLQRHFGQLNQKQLLMFALQDWMQVLPRLKLENKLELIEADYDRARAAANSNDAVLDELRINYQQLRDEFDTTVDTMRRRRTESLLQAFTHTVWLRCSQTRHIRELKVAATKKYEDACQVRDARIAILEKCIREDSHVTALETQCHELEWEMQQSLKGPPSKVVMSDKGVLCSSCLRQVVYQEYLRPETQAGIEPDAAIWELPLTPAVPHYKRFQRAWVP